MLPQDTASSISFGGLYLTPDERPVSPLIDYERGGVALLDTSQGLMSHNWRCFMAANDVFLQRDGQAAIPVFQAAGVTRLTFTFDQNMRYCIAYLQQDLLKLHWFDSVVGDFVTSNFGSAIDPRLSLDDKRPQAVLSSDMILAYLRGTSLCYRQQRDRFTIERTLRTGLFPNTRLRNIGMNKNLRLQFELV